MRAGSLSARSTRETNEKRAAAVRDLAAATAEIGVVALRNSTASLARQQ